MSCWNSAFQTITYL